MTSDPRRAAEELLASYQLDERTDTPALYATALALDQRSPRSVIRPGANTAAFDVDGDATPGPSEDKFGMTRQADPPRAR